MFWPPEHIEELRALQADKKLTAENIAMLLNRKFHTSYSRSAILGKIRREQRAVEGNVHRDNPELKRRGRTKPMTPEQEREFIKQWRAGIPLADIAHNVGFPQSTLSQRARILGLGDHPNRKPSYKKESSTPARVPGMPKVVADKWSAK